jgi:proline racemase
MRKHLIFVQTILATTALINAMNVYAQEKITIPAGTVISARLASQLDSGQVHSGDLVTMDVLESPFALKVSS